MKRELTNFSFSDDEPIGRCGRRAFVRGHGIHEQCWEPLFSSKPYCCFGNAVLLAPRKGADSGSIYGSAALCSTGCSQQKTFAIETGLQCVSSDELAFGRWCKEQSSWIVKTPDGEKHNVGSRTCN